MSLTLRAYKDSFYCQAINEADELLYCLLIEILCIFWILILGLQTFLLQIRFKRLSVYA